MSTLLAVQPHAPLAFLGNLGPMELVLILLIVVLLFGVRKLPELGKGLGEGIKNFRSSMKSASEDDAPPSAPDRDAAPKDSPR